MRVPARELGDTGVRVGAISLGTVKLGRTAALKHPSSGDLPTDAQARALLDAARTLGVNLLDTAPAYGASEARLGALLEGWRDDWLICTKAGEAFDGERSRYDFAPDALRASLERSLARLRTDRVDVLLLHSDGGEAGECARDETLAALREFKEAGKARFVGASTKTLAGARRCVQALDVVMLTLSERATADLPAIEAACAQGKGVLVKKALDSGWIAARSADAKEREQAVAAAIRFALAPAGVSSVVVGTTSPEHLRQVCSATQAAE